MSARPPRLCLVLPRHGKRFVHIRRRPRALPPFWQRISPPTGLSFRHKQEWELLLSSCGIPYYLDREYGREHLYVPPLCEQVARQEWLALAQDKTRARRPSAPVPPLYPCAGWTALAPLLLILWHGWRVGWWPCPSLLPDPALWTELGDLSSVRLAVQQQYYRCLTALTLHQDSPHLWGNVLFSLVFLPVLARAAGWGRALLLTVLGGMAGNALTYALRTGPFSSLGFSTAVFATLGGISGQACLYHQKSALLPLAAGLAIMALIGTGEENVDYLAHCCGFGSGFLLGLGNAWYTMRDRHPFPPQTACALLALLLPLVSWWMAFA